MQRVLALILLFALSTQLNAARRDTLVVQTFTYDSISTRRALFDFPTAGKSWEKVLMRYAIKCDEATPGDSYPCGEWDVTTHTRIFRHTGRLDSTRTEQDWFVTQGESPAELKLRNKPVWDYKYSWDQHRPADGHYLRFGGQTAVQLPDPALGSLDSTFTLATWLRGDPEQQPQSDQFFEAAASGARVINLHLPWSSMQVIFEAGGHAQGNNNRIQKGAEAAEVMGLWNHWVFCKDARSGIMSIWLNGALWHEAGNMGRSMERINHATLGANSGLNGGWYAGDADDFALWDRCLNPEEIQQLLLEGPCNLPEGQLLHWDFEQLEAGRVLDQSGNGNNGSLHGEPEQRPHGWLGLQDALPAIDASRILDSLQRAPITVEFHEDTLNLEKVSRRESWWSAGRRLTDALGRVMLEEELDADTLLEQRTLVAWGEAFEVIEEIELGRYITPYGKGLDLGENGFVHWRDVTDFLPLLEGTVDLEAHNGFELLDLSFWFIEGRPVREVLAIDPVWPLGGHRYGKIAEDDVLSPVLLTSLPQMKGASLLSTISGHGHAGPDHCCEWDPKQHAFSINGRERISWEIWTDCGMNPIHPQGGTWQFNRAGWCPGTFVDTYIHSLDKLLRPGEEFLLDYSIESPDEHNGEAEGYFIHNHLLVQYGPVLHKLDAELVEVLSPGTRDEHRRLGLSTHELKLVLGNRGSETLREIEFRYGLDDAPQRREKWTGSLAFMGRDTLSLPAPDWRGWVPGSRMWVEACRPNGKKDPTRDNNSLLVALPDPLILPDTLLIEVKSPDFGREKENRWILEDADGNIHASREKFFPDSLHRDEVILPRGAWHFLLTDNEEDGMIRHWWLRGIAPDKVGENGSVKILDKNGIELLNLGFDFAEKTEAWFLTGVPR